MRRTRTKTRTRTSVQKFTIFGAKHQIILPKTDHVTNLIVENYHLLSRHSVRKFVLSLAREKFWSINASSVIRRALSKCVDCRRHQGPVCEQKIADLPVDRLTPGRPPFTSVGIDCFGPFQVRRDRSLMKRYGVIFTCFAIRAVHVEVVNSLETDSFFDGIKTIYSEKGPSQRDQIR